MTIISKKFPYYSSSSLTIEDVTKDKGFEDVSDQELLEAAYKAHLALKKNLKDLSTCLDRVDNTLNEVCAILSVAPNTDTPVAPTHPQRTTLSVSQEGLDFPVKRMRNNLSDLNTHLMDIEKMTRELINVVGLPTQSPVLEIFSSSDIIDNVTDPSLSGSDGWSEKTDSSLTDFGLSSEEMDFSPPETQITHATYSYLV